MTKKLFRSLQTKHRLMMSVFIAFAMIILAPGVSAQAVRNTSDFNHMRTGFPLTGVHTNVECETCHVGGIFKGTPTDCAGCHSAGRRVVATPKPVNHIISNAPCETCHTNTVTFQGARFNHIGVQPRACMTCHNGGMGPGKPGGHVVTNLACDRCHRTSAWIPAGYDHIGVAPGSCANCHNGSTATGKSPSHVATTAACDTCHLNFTSFLGAIFNHTGVAPGTCGTCHNGQISGATTKVSNHIPYTGNACDSCHTNTSNYTSFLGPVMNHAVIGTTACKTCHATGTSYLGNMEKKAVTHNSPTAVDCAQSGCHKPGLNGRGTLYLIW
ncbi:MAG TPA: hypothetical protein VMV48_08125 [Gallionellaceae bacterium]|nr:hypothetical protein [Gallionellaceae bacterium]